MRTAAQRADPTVYPETDDMGEHELQTFITELLRPMIERWLGERSRVAHTGADQLFYWVKGDPTQCRAPDVYVIDGVPQDVPEVAVWKTWEGHRPAFALEICGDRWQKDYDDIPADYDAMGTTELVIFDPGATPRSRRRVRWQTWRRPAEGRLRRVASGMGDRVHSRALDCWLRVVDERGHSRLRLGTGWQGQTLVATLAELVDREQRAREAAEADALKERSAREAVERELATLREALAKLRKP